MSGPTDAVAAAREALSGGVGNPQDQEQLRRTDQGLDSGAEVGT